MKSMFHPFGFVAAFFVMLALGLSGCGTTSTPTTVPSTTPTGTVTPAQPNPLIALALQEGAEIGTVQGLKALAKNNPTAAAETAFNLKNSINNDILPFLSGGTLQTASEIQTLLNSSLFKGKIDPTVQNLIAAAATALQTYVPLTDPTRVLSPAETAYIKAFVSGVATGCANYNTKAFGPPTPRFIPFAE